MLAQSNLQDEIEGPEKATIVVSDLKATPGRPNESSGAASTLCQSFG
jgi:hypothetical protein